MPEKTKRVPYSSLTYSVPAARYRHSNGRFMSPESVRAVIEQDLDAAKDRMRANAARLVPIAQKYQDGDISQASYLEAVKAWRDGQASEIKAVILGDTAAACGGFHAMNQAAYGRAGQLIKTVLRDSLNPFVAEVASNPAIVTGTAKGRMDFVERNGMYSNEGLYAFEAQSLAEDIRVGRIFSVNVLEPQAHHCEPSKTKESCPEQTAKGAVHYSQMVRVGKRVCGGKCRCHERRFYTKEAAESFLGTS